MSQVSDDFIFELSGSRMITSVEPTGPVKNETKQERNVVGSN